MAVQRALISVFDKTGVLQIAKRLAALNIEILSTGGTAQLLRESGVAVKDVSEFTGWPEMLGGRVKTLHPKVHGGLLYRRNLAEDQKQAKEHGITAIDLVVVNLYPFEATAAKAELTAEELIENIDIGGPTMLRSAAKNWESVTVVTDPADYQRVAAALLPFAGEAAAVALRRKSASGRRSLYSLGQNSIWIGRRQTASGQRAFLQQLCGFGSSAQHCRRVSEARCCHYQAQQSVRHRGTTNLARSVPESVCLRSDFRVWWRAGVQSRSGRGDRRGSCKTFCRVYRGSWF